MYLMDSHKNWWNSNERPLGMCWLQKSYFLDVKSRCDSFIHL